MALLVAHELGLAAVMQGGWRAAQGHAGECDGAQGQGRAKARTGQGHSWRLARGGRECTATAVLLLHGGGDAGARASDAREVVGG
jgi:hypothetical protein